METALALIGLVISSIALWVIIGWIRSVGVKACDCPSCEEFNSR